MFCPDCGEKNSDDSEFCIKCGTAFSKHAGDSVFEQRVTDFAEEVEKTGKKVGKKVEEAAKKFADDTGEMGKRIEKKMDKVEKNIGQWHERVFGVFGPLISSFIGLIVFRLVIEFLRISGDEAPVMGSIATALYSYLLWLFVGMLLASYTEYFSRKYKPFRWVSPVLSAICFAIFLWLVSRILFSLGGNLGITGLVSAAGVVERYLPMIFVFVVLFGYMIQLFTYSVEKDEQQKRG
ncbi:MAG: zinc ribbon domain-containing protein [Methanobacteriota archaeon]